MKTLLFATANVNKLREVQEITGKDYNIKGLREINFLAEIPETEDTIEGNALQKARFLHERIQTNCFADDTGLEVEALNGAPGVHSARYAGKSKDDKANVKKLLQELEDKSNRKARFKTVIALIFKGKEHTFEGIVNGHIAKEPKGDSGFGYDPVFIPENYDKTFAELDSEEKNRISHRALAVQKLADFLEKQK
jgi:XTP/dITP diphosphohydrolase